MALRCNACGAPYAPGSVHNCPAQERAEAALSDALERQWSQQECIGPEPEPSETDTPPASAPGSGETVAFVQDADCSHDRVMRVTQTIVGGAMAEWWQCGNCPARFELADSSRESMEDVVREVLCRAFEDGTELIPAFHEWYDASQWFWWGRALGAFIGTEARKREQRARAEVVTGLMDQLGVMSVQDDPRTMSANPTDWMAAGLDAIKQAARAEGEAKGRREALEWAEKHHPIWVDRFDGEAGDVVQRETVEEYVARGLAAPAEGGGE